MSLFVNRYRASSTNTTFNVVWALVILLLTSIAMQVKSYAVDENYPYYGSTYTYYREVICQPDGFEFNHYAVKGGDLTKPHSILIGEKTCNASGVKYEVEFRSGGDMSEEYVRNFGSCEIIVLYRDKQKIFEQRLRDCGYFGSALTSIKWINSSDKPSVNFVSHMEFMYPKKFVNNGQPIYTTSGKFWISRQHVENSPMCQELLTVLNRTPNDDLRYCKPLDFSGTNFQQLDYQVLDIDGQLAAEKKILNKRHKLAKYGSRKNINWRDIKEDIKQQLVERNAIGYPPLLGGQLPKDVKGLKGIDGKNIRFIQQPYAAHSCEPIQGKRGPVYHVLDRDKSITEKKRLEHGNNFGFARETSMFIDDEYFTNAIDFLIYDGQLLKLNKKYHNKNAYYKGTHEQSGYDILDSTLVGIKKENNKRRHVAMCTLSTLKQNVR